MKTQHVYLEHANITVNSLERTVHFFQTAFPDFKVRGGGNNNGREWIHLGNDTTYVALNENPEPQQEQHDKHYEKNGFNHIGFVVSNVDAIAKSLLKSGYKRDYPKQVERFRIRDYFIDADGNEYEFVEYLSDTIEERNSFEA